MPKLSAIRTWLTLLSMEFAALRLFRSYVLIITFLAPLSMAWALIFFASFIGPWAATYAVIGFSTASMIGGFMAFLAQQVGNMMDLDIYELIHTLPVSFREVVSVKASLTFLTILPQQVAAFTILPILGHAVSPGLGLIGVAASALTACLIGMMIGGLFREALKAGAVGNVAAYAMIILSPVYFPLSAMPEPMRWVALLIPATHMAEILRASVGLNELPLQLSVPYLLFLNTILIYIVGKSLKPRL